MTTYMNRVNLRANGDQNCRAPYPQKDCVHLIDVGLYSEPGAQEIIAHIRSRRLVKQLVLGHNKLGDSGCRALFQFLCSEEGQLYEIHDISLNSNGIGDSGLEAVARYLEGSQSVRELFLQNNEFSGNPRTATILADAVNASHLEILSLTSNRHMSDSFVGTFLPALTSNRLRELHLSAMNITRRSLPHIVEYILTKRCNLNVFKCNGNILGWPGVRSIIEAARDHNYSLTTLELHSNYLLDVTAVEDIGTNQEISGVVWKECLQSIQIIVSRNEQLGRETRRQALRLLHYARAVLLHPRPSSAEPSRWSENVSNVEKHKQSNFSFSDLPLEMQLYILSFISPILSPRQRSSIFNYAASPLTLPSLLPRLTGSTTSWRGVASHRFSGGRGTERLRNPIGDRDEGSRWLTVVGCTMYEQ